MKSSLPAIAMAAVGIEPAHLRVLRLTACEQAVEGFDQAA